MKLYKHASHVILMIALAFTGIFASGSAGASGATTTLAHVLVWSVGNLVYVYPTDAITGGPACGSAHPYYSFSYSRPMAAAYLAGLLAAQARGATVTIWGAGTCTDESYSETLDYFEVS